MTLTDQIRAARMEAQAHERHAVTCHNKSKRLFEKAYPDGTRVEFYDQHLISMVKSYYTGVIIGHGSQGFEAIVLIITPQCRVGNKMKVSLADLERGRK